MTIQLHSEFNVFTGLNGAGKTSILDAMYYVTNGKSYFSSQDKYLYRYGSDYFRIEAKITHGSETYITELSSAANKKKQIKCDDKIMPSILDYYGRFPSFMIAPKDIMILIESSAERRKLVDRTLSQVDAVYFECLLKYNKLLKQRNAALKSFIKSRQTDHLLLDTLDDKMASPAQVIYETRAQYLEELGPIFSKYYSEISASREDISIGYKSQLSSDSFSALRKNSRLKDVVTGKTNDGIHRDDLLFWLGEHELRKYGSQGQLKSSIIALKLAQIDWVRLKSGKSPILLLDDIFDKLDMERVNKLIDICHNRMGSQICVTDTDGKRMSEVLNNLNLNYTHFNVENGKIDNGS